MLSFVYKKIGDDSMNEVIKQLEKRRSVREFTGEKVKDKDLELILLTLQAHPRT